MNDEIKQLLDTFSSNYKVRNYKKEDVVIREDDEPVGVFLVKEGVIKMSSINEDGEELGVNIYKPGSFFPMTWAISEISNDYNYQAMTSASLVVIPKDKFVEFLKENPIVLYDLTSRILVGLDGLLFNVRHLLVGDSTSKIAVVLYMLGKRFGVKKEKHIEIDLTLTHQDIAHFAGITRETTTIAIDKLVKDGIILQGQRKIIIKDIEALKNSF